MNKKAFTLIELLAVIVILAIISLIAVPIIMDVINDSKYESQKRSIDGYASALKNAVATYQLKNNVKVTGRFVTTDGKVITREDKSIPVNYKGNVVCDKIIINKDGSIYVSECSVDGNKIYESQEEGKKENPTHYYEYGKTEYGMIMERKLKQYSYEFFDTKVSTDRISQFTIENEINIPEGYESKDCSYNQDGSVMCYWKNWAHLNRANEYEMHVASDGEMYAPYDSSYLFCRLGASYYNSLRTLDLTGLNTSKTINMSHMFDTVGTNIRTFSFGDKFDTSNVTNMSYMFKDAFHNSISSVIFPDSFDTSKVTDMSNMFYNSFLYAQNISFGNNFDTSNVTNMSGMFKEFGKYIIRELDLGDKFNTKNVTDMSNMFASIGNRNSYFKQLDLGSNFDTSSVINMSSMFERLTIEQLNLGDKFDTSNVTNMREMFAYNEKLKTLSLGSKFNTNNVTDMYRMFAGLKLINELNLGNQFDTSNVTNMEGMFENTGQNSITNLDLGDKFDTKNVQTMRRMFYQTGYDNMTELNLGTKFDTKNVEDMWQMFYQIGYEKLEELNLGDNFDTSNAGNMESMFYQAGYKNMKKLDIGKKFVASTTRKSWELNFDNMFREAGKESMEELYLWNFGNYTRPSSYYRDDIFKDCGTEGVLTKVVVSTNEFKNTLMNESSVPDFWKANDGTLIIVQSS